MSSCVDECQEMGVLGVMLLRVPDLVQGVEAEENRGKGAQDDFKDGVPGGPVAWAQRRVANTLTEQSRVPD